MSLLEPSLIEKIKQHKKLLTYLALGIFLFGMILFLHQCGSDYLFKRDIDKKTEAVNSALAEANQVGANINAEREAANRIAQNVNVATQEYLEAANVTDATRESVNAALERMHKAANSNVGNVNAQDVENAMRGF